MLLGDVADQLLDDDRLAHAGAAKDADLTALGKGRDQVDNLQAGFEHLRRRRQVFELRRGTVDRVIGLGLDRLLLVDRLAQDVEHAAERRGSNGNADRRARVDGLCATRQSVGRGHGNGAHPVVAEMLLDLADERGTGPLQLYGIEDRRQMAGRKFDVNDWTGDRDDGTAGGSAPRGLGDSHVNYRTSWVKTRSRRSRFRSFRE